VAFVCLEHFTGVVNPDTHSLGLDPELISLWLAHEFAHAVRYTSPTSGSALRALIAARGGDYSYWETGRDATLRELLVNEGLAVQASRLISPGHTRACAICRRPSRAPRRRTWTARGSGCGSASCREG
jgi:hypothetical protein